MAQSINFDEFGSEDVEVFLRHLNSPVQVLVVVQCRVCMSIASHGSRMREGLKAAHAHEHSDSHKKNKDQVLKYQYSEHHFSGVYPGESKSDSICACCLLPFNSSVHLDAEAHSSLDKALPPVEIPLPTHLFSFAGLGPPPQSLQPDDVCQYCGKMKVDEIHQVIKHLFESNTMGTQKHHNDLCAKCGHYYSDHKQYNYNMEISFQKEATPASFSGEANKLQEEVGYMTEIGLFKAHPFQGTGSLCTTCGENSLFKAHTAFPIDFMKSHEFVQSNFVGGNCACGKLPNDLIHYPDDSELSVTSHHYQAHPEGKPVCGDCGLTESAHKYKFKFNDPF